MADIVSGVAFRPTLGDPRLLRRRNRSRVEERQHLESGADEPVARSRPVLVRRGEKGLDLALQTVIRG